LVGKVTMEMETEMEKMENILTMVTIMIIKIKKKNLIYKDL